MHDFVTRALVIAEPWLEMILSGRKVWEMRSRHTSVRGWIGLIRKGSGKVVGAAYLSDVGDQMTCEELLACVDRHQITPEQLMSGAVSRWNVPWHFSRVVRFDQPVPYTHRSGAVTWISLDDEIASKVSGRLGRVATGVVERSFEPLARANPAGQLTPRSSLEVARDGTCFQSVSDDGSCLIALGITQITDGNIRNNHFYIKKFLHNFPASLINGRQAQPPVLATLVSHGMAAAQTDICPRHRFFRDRAWTRRFFELNGAKAGDQIVVRERGPFHYVLVYQPVAAGLSAI